MLECTTILLIARASVAIIVAVACGAILVMLAHCAAACGAAHSPGPASTPSCHHAASARAQIGCVPTPCGHDHRMSVTTRAVEPAPTRRAPVTAVGMSPEPVVRTDVDAHGIEVRSIGSPPTLHSHTLALPLSHLDYRSAFQIRRCIDRVAQGQCPSFLSWNIDTTFCTPHSRFGDVVHTRGLAWHRVGEGARCPDSVSPGSGSGYDATRVHGHELRLAVHA